MSDCERRVISECHYAPREFRSPAAIAARRAMLREPHVAPLTGRRSSRYPSLYPPPPPHLRDDVGEARADAVDRIISRPISSAWPPPTRTLRSPDAKHSDAFTASSSGRLTSRRTATRKIAANAATSTKPITRKRLRVAATSAVTSSRGTTPPISRGHSGSSSADHAPGQRLASLAFDLKNRIDQLQMVSVRIESNIPATTSIFRTNTLPLASKLMLNGSTPIGIFDSGLGGLSVVDAIHRRLPEESIVYVADSRYAPYGEKPDEFIRTRSRALAEWLVQRGTKMLVVACNTATTHAITYLRSQFAIPIVGVEPGIKPAVQLSVSKIIGVLATDATLRSQRLQGLLASHQHDCRFVCQAGHGLVELIEQGLTAGSSLDALLEKYLTPMVKEGADTLVLGSTHYALLIPSIQRVFGGQFRLVETATAIARRVDHQLAEHRLRAAANCAATLRLCSTASTANRRAPLEQLANGLFFTGHRVAAINVDTR
jgi:glutamate racemase